MDGLVIIGILVLGGFIIKAVGSKGTAGMNDAETTLANIRRGVANGWYSCVLTRVNGKPAVRLSGKSTDGNTYSDVYPVSEETWQTLKADGYEII